MDIYPQNQNCFVYKWIELSTNKWYIGSHTSKSAHPNDGYICSSKIVKPLILENPNEWVRVILETGEAKAMVQLEHELLTRLNAAKSIYSYNRTNGGKLNTTGITPSIETRIKLSNANKGKSITDEHRENLIKAQKNRKPISNETRIKLSKWNSSRIRKPCSIEAKDNISKAKKGKPSRLKDKIQTSIMCPHCNKNGGISAMKRWHFDNCSQI